MNADYKPTTSSFREFLKSLATQHKKVTLYYRTELKELLSVTALIKELPEEDGADFLRLSSGETIRLDQLVRVDDQAAPGFEDYTFGYSCTL